MMNNEIRVWDPLIRIFHWGLVLAFTVAYLSGDEESSLHIYSGYAVLGLIAFRVLWGLIGTRYARFSNFVHSPGSVFQYLKSLAGGKPKHYMGHNPAAGWMVMVMLLTLFVVTLSGLKVYAYEEGSDLFAGATPVVTVISAAYADSDSGGENEVFEEFWEEIHEVSSNFMLLLIFLHITGVIVSGRLHHEHLVRAMVTGKKTSKTGN
ncbi:MAG: cytochrome b/b6 domain-containing protein [Thiohalobacterales bacterium]